MAAAAADEVSVQIAALFSQSAVGYQDATAQATAYYEQFIRTLTAGSNAYVAAESAAAQVVGSAASVETALQLALSGNFSGLAAELNAGLSGLGAQLSTALSGNLSLEGIAANLGLNLNGNFQGGLPSLSGFVQTGQSLAANLNSAISAGLNGLTGLSGGFGASLPALAGQFSAALNGLGGSFAANLPGLTGGFGGQLSNLGAQLNAALSGNFTGGLPDLSALAQTGASLAGNLSAALNNLGGSFAANLPGLSGGFAGSLPALAAQLNAALSGGFSGALPDLSALGQTGATLASNFSAALNNLGGSFAANLPGLSGSFAGSLPALAAQLNAALTGGFSGGLPDLSAFGQTGATLAGNINAALNNLGGAINVNLPAVTAALGADLSGLGGRIDAALTGALAGDFDGFSALVDATAGLPTITLDAAGLTQANLLSGFVEGQIDFNEALVANEIALQTAIFGPNLNPAVTAGFNAFNVLLGTGEQTINALLGAPIPTDFTGSLIIGADIDGGIPTGGLIGLLDQAVALNAALGGPAIDASFLSNLQLTGANIVADQLAFNAAVVANVADLQLSLFGTTGAFNGVINNAVNMVGGVVVSAQQVFNTLLGFPMPADFGTSLIVNGSGDVFGGVATGGLVGAFENKWLMDLAFLSNLGFPVQVLLNGGLPQVLADLNAVLTGNVVVEGGVDIGQQPIP